MNNNRASILLLLELLGIPTGLIWFLFHGDYYTAPAFVAILSTFILLSTFFWILVFSSRRDILLDTHKDQRLQRAYSSIVLSPLLLFLLTPFDIGTIEFGPINDVLAYFVLLSIVVFYLLCVFSLYIRSQTGASSPGSIINVVIAVSYVALLFFVGHSVVHPEYAIWTRFARRTETYILVLYCIAYMGAGGILSVAILGPPDRGSRASRSFLYNVVLSVCLALIYLSGRVMALGDRDFWIDHSLGKTLYASELLSNYLYYTLNVLGVSFDYVAPVCGFVTMLMTLCFIDRHVLRDHEQPRSRKQKLLTRLLILASGLHLVFFKGYIENTYLGLPFLIASLHWQISYLSDTDRGKNDGQITLAGALLCVACMIHGQFVFMVPALILIIFIKNYTTRSPLGLFRHIVYVGLFCSIVVFSTSALLTSFGFTIVEGNYYGGGDGARFAPLFHGVYAGDFSKGRDGIKFYPASSEFAFTQLCSVKNLVETTNLIVLASPTVLFLLFPIIKQMKDRHVYPECQASIVLLLHGVLYIVFVFVWHFDLGYPWDYDLMLTMSLPLHLWMIHLWVVRKPVSLSAIFAIATCSVVLCWGYLSRYYIENG